MFKVRCVISENDIWSNGLILGQIYTVIQELWVPIPISSINVLYYILSEINSGNFDDGSYHSGFFKVINTPVDYMAITRSVI